MTQPSTQAPLRGLKILDLSQGFAGPYGTMLLALAGAEVTKVEPLEGDWSRTLGAAREGESIYSLAFNRGKKSIALNAKAPEGKAILARLVEQCDVVVRKLQARLHRPPWLRLRGHGQAKTRASSTARCRVSARPGPTRCGPRWTA